MLVELRLVATTPAQMALALVLPSSALSVLYQFNDDVEGRRRWLLVIPATSIAFVTFSVANSNSVATTVVAACLPILAPAPPAVRQFQHHCADNAFHCTPS